MNSTLLTSLKASGKLTLAVTSLFFAGILVSAYLLFTLPHHLIINGGLPTLELAWPVLTGVFVSVGVTFILAIAALNITLQSRKETIVYIEKKKEDQSNTGQRDEGVIAGLQDITSFTATLKLAKDGMDVLQHGLNTICQQLQAGQGAIYKLEKRDGKRVVELKYGFALSIGETSAPRFEVGEGLIGQAAASGKSMYLDEVPEGYITIVSGLGTASPRYLLIVPIRKGDEVNGVLEVATFSPLPESQRNRIEEMVHVLAEKIK